MFRVKQLLSLGGAGAHKEKSRPRIGRVGFNPVLARCLRTSLCGISHCDFAGDKHCGAIISTKKNMLGLGWEAQRNLKGSNVAKVAAFHSKLPNAPQVYHDDNQCTEGNNIEPRNRESGTGGRPKCEHCQRL